MTWSSPLNRRKITREADPPEDQHGRKGTSGQHGQNKVLISGPGLDMLQESGKDPCGVCLKSDAS